MGKIFLVYTSLTIAEILGALSHALDMTEGLPRGHAQRTAYIALRIAQELQLSETEQRDLYKACLLKDAGCTECAVRLYQAFAADDILLKRETKLNNLSNPVQTMWYALKHFPIGKTVMHRILYLMRHHEEQVRLFNAIRRARCARGADIARYIGFTEQVAQAIECLDERWDGGGYPYQLAGDQIPLLAQIVSLSQMMEIFATVLGVEAAYAMARKRSQRWFDPRLVQVALSFETDYAFWNTHAEMVHNPPMQMPVIDFTRRVETVDIDRVCEAFARVVDAKSIYTGDHSRRVAHYAVSAAITLEWDAELVQRIYWAGLLHDLGKLSVPTSILEKPSKLTDEEFALVRKHPEYTYEILRGIRGFEWIAEVAGAHHERLDGRGYWQGLTAEQLTPPMRLLAVADVYDALSAKRPYRPALPPDEVFAIMERESGTALDGELVQALKSALHSETFLALPAA